MTHRRKLSIILSVETFLFALASRLHTGGPVSGFEHGRAMIGDGDIGAVLGLRLLAPLIWTTRVAIIALTRRGLGFAARSSAPSRSGSGRRRAATPCFSSSCRLYF